MTIRCTECHADGSDCRHCRATGQEPCRACCCRPRQSATQIADGVPCCDTCAFVGTCQVCKGPYAVEGVAYGNVPACGECLGQYRQYMRAIGRAA